MIKLLLRILILTVVFLVGALIVALQVPYVQRSLFAWGMEQWELHKGIHIEAAEFYGFPPFYITAKEVTYVEDGVPWIYAPEVSVSFSPLELLFKQIVFTRMTIEDPVIFRRIAKETEAVPSSWALHFNNVEIRNLRLGKDLLDALPHNLFSERVRALPPLDLEGSAFVYFKTNEWAVGVDIFEGDTKTALHLYGKKELSPATLAISLNFEEDRRGGLFARLALPHPILDLKGEANLEGDFLTWKKLFNEQLPNFSPLTGSLRLEGTGKENPLIAPIHISSKATLSGERALLLTELTLQSPLLSAEGTLDLSPTLQINQGLFNTELFLAPLAKKQKWDLEGSLKGKFALTGSFPDPMLSWELNDQSLTFHKEQVLLHAIKLAFSGTVEKAQGNLLLRTEYQGEQASFESNLSWENSTLHFADLQVDSSIGEAAGDLSILFPDYLLDGRLEGRWKEIHKITSAFGYPYSGSLQMALSLHPDLDSITNTSHQGAKGSFILHHLQAPSLKTDQISLDFDLVSQPSFPYFKGKLDTGVRKFKWWRLELEEASFSTAMDPQQEEIPFHFQVSGKKNHTFDIQGSGLWRSSPSTKEVVGHFDKFSIEMEHSKFLLDHPAAIHFGATSFTVSSFQLSLFENNETTPKGDLHLSMNKTENSLSSDWEAKDIPLALVHELIPDFHAVGFLSSHGKLETQREHLLGNGEFFIAKLNSTEIPLQQPVELSLSVNLTPTELSIHGETLSSKQPFGALSLSTPLSINASTLKPILEDPTPLKGKVFFSGRIGPAAAFFLDERHQVLGALNLQMDLAGTLQNPLLTGHGSLTHGRYESLQTGFTLKDISFLLEGTGSELVLKNLSANMGPSKILQGEGIVHLDLSQKFPYRLNLRPDNLTLFQNDFADVSIKGSLALEGNLEAAALKGNLGFNAVNISIPKKLPTSIPELEVTYIDEHGRTYVPQAKIEEQARSRYPITLDVTAESRGGLFLKGRGLDSEWRGSVQVTGSLYDPKIHGVFKIKSGSFELAGSQMHITQGVLTLNGSPQQASISVQAEKQLAHVKVYASLKGPVKNPQLNLYSSPDLPRAEIVSLFLFNKHTANISAAEGIQLAQTLSTLSGTEGGVNILGSIQRAVGIDRLNVDSTLVEETGERRYSIRAGKYIFKGLLLSFNKCINSSHQSVGLEFGLIRNVKLEAELSADGHSMLSLKWQYDY